MSASVKIMRSYDYCHFEICLGTDEAVTLLDVDDMRKEAMRLVDKAVEQYKTAKEVRDYQQNNLYHYKCLEEKVQEIIDKVPETERTPQQKASIKELSDHHHEMQRQYDYEDDWNWH